MDLFKNWVPPLVIKIILFCLLVPNMVMFFLPVANEEMAASYYGVETNDIQYMISLYYVGFASFYSLERRFYAYMTSKEYFLVFQILQLICSFLLYSNDHLIVLFGVRFFQGMLFASSVNLYMSLVIKTMKTYRAKEMTYSLFFGMLLCTGSFNNLITADVLDQFNFGFLFQCAIVTYAICVIVVLIFMNNKIPFRQKPLIKLDFSSFVLLSTILACFGYLSVYGQQYYWFENSKISIILAVSLLSLALFLVRQYKNKRPYIHLDIFKYKKFLFGTMILFFMYLERFSFTYSGQFFKNVLLMDPKYVSYIFSINIVGIISGVAIAAWWLINKKKVTALWVLGFISLFAYHFSMRFLMFSSGNYDYYFMPMFVHGFGIGIIMVPCILYCLSAVPYYLSPSAAAFCLIIRFLGYATSNLLIKYYSIYHAQIHYNRFLQSLTNNNSFYQQKLDQIKLHLQDHGIDKNLENPVSEKMMSSILNRHILMRSIMDYYSLMMYISVCIIFILAIYWLKNKNYKVIFRPLSPI